MKKFFLTLAFLFVFFSFLTPSYADSEFFAPVCVTVNGEYVKTDKQAYLKGASTMVSLRDIGDIFSSSVSWDEKTATANVSTANTNVSVTKGKSTATINGKSVRLSSPAVIVNDRLFVPLRFLSESFGAKVTWDGATLTANITSSGAHIPKHLKGASAYKEDELLWLSKIVSAEAKGEKNQGKVAVANVVLNRVKSPEFPDTIYGVIFDKKYGVQFTPTLDGSIYDAPTASSIIAAKRALLGEDISKKSLYFLNPKTAQNTWIIKNRKFLMTIGNHDFYL